MIGKKAKRKTALGKDKADPPSTYSARIEKSLKTAHTVGALGIAVKERHTVLLSTLPAPFQNLCKQASAVDVNLAILGNFKGRPFRAYLQYAQNEENHTKTMLTNCRLFHIFDHFGKSMLPKRLRESAYTIEFLYSILSQHS